MAYRDFQEFLLRLEQENELKRIHYPLDPYLEITEVADRVMKSGGPALLIERPKGYDIAVAINTMGSKRRMSLALGVDDYETVAREIEELTKPELPQLEGGLLGKLRAIPEIMPQLGKLLKVARSVPPTTVKEGVSQEVVKTGDEVDLSEFPILHCYPKTAGDISRCRWCLRTTPTRASAMWACIAFKCWISAPPQCTGKSIR